MLPLYNVSWDALDYTGRLEKNKGGFPAKQHLPYFGDCEYVLYTRLQWQRIMGEEPGPCRHHGELR